MVRLRLLRFKGKRLPTIDEWNLQVWLRHQKTALPSLA